MLTWFEPYHTVLDTSNPPFWKWFVGGKINASYNCVDRHLAQYRNKAALLFVGEPEDEPPVALTYQELYVQVNEMAALLRDFCGLKAGDRVTLHLPMTLELPITMLACARLGVIHSQVFGGFSGQACGTRIQDSGSHILISMDAYWRAGKLIDHKVNADIAVETAKEMGQHVDKVLIWQRYPGKYNSPTPMVKGRDFFVNEVLKQYQGKRVDPVPMDAEAPLVPDVHQRQHRQAERLPTPHRRLSRLRHRHLQIHPGHSSDRHLLVHGGYRLDHRPFVYRLWSARHRGDQRRVRRRSHASRCGASVENRRAPGRQYLPHLADRDSRAQESGGRGTAESTTTTSST